MADKVEIIILHETVRQSWLCDAWTFVVIVAVIGTGWLLGSEAMQWCGFVMLALSSIVRARTHRDRLTPQQAADRLHATYGVRASGAQTVEAH
ncbi:MAG: hypothetical protein AB1918_19265 [Pseudomonadota bacterium]